MTSFIKNPLYVSELRNFSKKIKNINRLNKKIIMITGATGMIGSCIIDILMLHNNFDSLNCKVIAVGRNSRKAYERFADYWNLNNFTFINADVNEVLDYPGHIDYIIHAASNTHPIAYATEPIDTILTNVIGTNNLLSFATRKKSIKRFIFISSVEIYGQNKGDINKFDEKYLGYINCNTLRAGYPESKRVGEALCQAYIKQEGLDIVIPRLARAFGPTMLMTDSKALSQFIKRALNKKNIILKSDGKQNFSYIYSIDAACAILFCLLNGKKGEAYNVNNPLCDTTLRSLAQTIANIAHTSLVFELPDRIEASGYSTATKALMNPDKMIDLGYFYDTDLRRSLINTLKILGTSK